MLFERTVRVALATGVEVTVRGFFVGVIEGIGRGVALATGILVGARVGVIAFVEDAVGRGTTVGDTVLPHPTNANARTTNPIHPL